MVRRSAVLFACMILPKTLRAALQKLNPLPSPDLPQLLVFLEALVCLVSLAFLESKVTPDSCISPVKFIPELLRQLVETPKERLPAI